MATELYAWAPITARDAVTKGKFVMIPVGSKVKLNDLGQDDWDNLVAAGVLRKKPYPKDVRTGESPRQAELRKVNDEMKRLQDPFRHELDDDDDDLEGEDGGNTSES